MDWFKGFHKPTLLTVGVVFIVVLVVYHCCFHMSGTAAAQ